MCQLAEHINWIAIAGALFFGAFLGMLIVALLNANRYGEGK